MTGVDRRSFLRRSASGLVLPASLAGLATAIAEDAEAAQTEVGGSRSYRGGYGPLTNDQGILLLPEGFRMRVISAIGDPMRDGRPTPIAFDGMAAFAHGPERVRLVRNHEDRNHEVEGGQVPAIGPNPYDPVAGGGTTTVEVDREGELIGSWVSLSGTATNCAGGPTPWGSWLSCEETVAGPAEGLEKTHGWIFEVPAEAEGPVDPIPYREMGRFAHEAVCVDPWTGIVYETEDHQAPPGSGFYRFLPVEPGRLALGGRLQTARVVGDPRIELWRGTGSGIEPGQIFQVEWVDIPYFDPGDESGEATRKAEVFMQGFDAGAAAFSRLEGCWFGQGSVFFHDTNAGARRAGHVWQYVPAEREGQGGPEDRGLLRLIYESPERSTLDSPDNITVSPRGGLVLCEDSNRPFLRGLTREGEIFDLAENRLNDHEFAGACFSPDGHTLYVNIQGPTRGRPEDPAVHGRGVTLAIRGPWGIGAL
jgi:uncharacterized protein